ncbi:hypothetical protein BDY21DRAFT_185490 [Lineolata rhizophorae]|uniref:Uncharacterized protein n=1 Tax=Lineolata rhizophorae TaxID=578093 RepID=A0A6A6P7Y9_9PEZI|nr:hypothetical protein BDY21DRAFT_185490 [Lineolata rhizophorae]
MCGNQHMHTDALPSPVWLAVLLGDRSDPAPLPTSSNRARARDTSPTYIRTSAAGTADPGCSILAPTSSTERAEGFAGGRGNDGCAERARATSRNRSIAGGREERFFYPAGMGRWTSMRVRARTFCMDRRVDGGAVRFGAGNRVWRDGERGGEGCQQTFPVRSSESRAGGMIGCRGREWPPRVRTHLFADDDGMRRESNFEDARGRAVRKASTTIWGMANRSISRRRRDGGVAGPF